MSVAGKCGRRRGAWSDRDRAGFHDAVYDEITERHP